MLRGASHKGWPSIDSGLRQAPAVPEMSVVSAVVHAEQLKSSRHGPAMPLVARLHAPLAMLHCNCLPSWFHLGTGRGDVRQKEKMMKETGQGRVGRSLGLEDGRR